MCASGGEIACVRHFVCRLVLDVGICASACVCKLTGTLGSDTAMLSGYTLAFTHWLRVAAKRYGSSARSHRFL